MFHMHPRAGQPAQPEDLVDVDALLKAYDDIVPDVENPAQKVVFGTSGHRGSSLDGAFNEAHILAITQAICEYRAGEGTAGPLLVGRDSHGLSEPAWRTVLEVLAGNDVQTLVDSADRLTPTPGVSHAILRLNRGAGAGADGIVITPSHNPPRDGGIKYNPPHGGPADSDATGWIAARANELIAGGNREVRRKPFDQARSQAGEYDFVGHYVDDLPSVLNLDAIRSAGVKIGADPLGGASVDYWAAIGERHGLDLTVVNPTIDPAWSFMTLDHDGKIRMDCSSPYAMASLVAQRDKYDVATGNDADADRHGIVTPDAGLMNPNHYLAVAINYLLTSRPRWPAQAAVGKTIVSSGMIDRVVEKCGSRLSAVPVGFKWFVPGLFEGSLCFGGEESAGASFLRHDGTAWSTDKDGPIMALLAAEITARTGKDPGEHYRALTAEFGTPYYTRLDAAATPEEKARLAQLSPAAVETSQLAGESITAKLSHAPGNRAPIGGLKVIARSGWFAARPSGTENIYKIYAESFKDQAHLDAIVSEAQAMVNRALGR
jgi:phosphoglucomutase